MTEGIHDDSLDLTTGRGGTGVVATGVIGQVWAIPSSVYWSGNDTHSTLYANHYAVHTNNGWLVLCWMETFQGVDEDGKYVGGTRLRPVEKGELEQVDL